MTDINIVVNSVTIRQLRKATFSNILSLSIIELNIVASFVTIGQLRTAAFKNM